MSGAGSLFIVWCWQSVHCEAIFWKFCQQLTTHVVVTFYDSSIVAPCHHYYQLAESTGDELWARHHEKYNWLYTEGSYTTSCFLKFRNSEFQKFRSLEIQKFRLMASLHHPSRPSWWKNSTCKKCWVVVTPCKYYTSQQTKWVNSCWVLLEFGSTNKERLQGGLFLKFWNSEIPNFQISEIMYCIL